MDLRRIEGNEHLLDQPPEDIWREMMLSDHVNPFIQKIIAETAVMMLHKHRGEASAIVRPARAWLRDKSGP